MMRVMSRRSSRNAPLASLRRFVRQAVAAVVLGGVLLIAAAFVALAVQGNAVARDASATQQEIARLEQDIATKRAQVAARQSDQYIVDRAVDLGFVRPGEALVAVQREARQASESVVAAGPSRLAKWLGVFFR